MVANIMKLHIFPNMSHARLAKIDKGNHRALSQMISIVEEGGNEATQLLHDLRSKKKGSRVLGITGPPGAGKSTLISKLIGLMRARGESVAVVAVDPTSPFSGGAVLGDRIRMMEHATDDGVFIRSLGSRGSHGGLSRAAGDVVACFDAAGFDWIILESVGVGQTELAIADIAETTIVVLVPEAGDAIQTMKAGLMEIANIFVINKSDRSGADTLSRALSEEYALSIPVLTTSAMKNEGIEKVFAAIMEHRQRLGKQ